jgi:hypothetical protein
VSAVAPYRNPLDVLWRAVPTPFRAEMRLAGRRIAVESNDPAILVLLPTPPDAAPSGESDFLWRVVRDAEASGALEPGVAFDDGPLSLVTMGSALTIAVDHERNELLAFVGASVPLTIFSALALPLFEKMTLGSIASMGSGALSIATSAGASSFAGHENAQG